MGILHIQGGFFNWSALKMTKSQTLRKLTLRTFLKGFTCNLTLSHILGGPVKKTTLYNRADFATLWCHPSEYLLVIVNDSE